MGKGKGSKAAPKGGKGRRDSRPPPRSFRDDPRDDRRDVRDDRGGDRYAPYPTRGNSRERAPRGGKGGKDADRNEQGRRAAQPVPRRGYEGSNPNPNKNKGGKGGKDDYHNNRNPMNKKNLPPHDPNTPRANTRTQNLPTPFFPFHEKHYSSLQVAARYANDASHPFTPLPHATSYTSYIDSIPSGSVSVVRDGESVKMSTGKETRTVSEEDAVLAAFEEEGGEGQIRVHVLPLHSDFAAKRIRLMACQSLLSNTSPATSYGGIVDNNGGFASHILPQLLPLLEAQTGHDFSHATWRVLGKVSQPSGLDHLYVIPEMKGEFTFDTTNLEREVTNVVKTVKTEEVEEEVEEVDGETVEERQERLAAVKKTVEKVIEEEVVTKESKELLMAVSVDVTILPLRHATRRASLKQPSSGVVSNELKHGLLFLHDLLRREALHHIRAFLAVKNEVETEGVAAMAESRERDAALLKTVSEHEASRDEEIKSRVEELEKRWKEEDEGETQDEVEEKEPGRKKEREAIRTEVMGTCAETVKELREGHNAEKKHLTTEVNKAVMFSMQIFEGGASINQSTKVDKKMLVKAMLATDTNLTHWEAEEALAIIAKDTLCQDAATVKRAVYVTKRAEADTADTPMADDDVANPQADLEFGDDAMDIDADVDYETLSYKQLQTLCKERGLSASGKAATLIERLQAE